MLLFEGQGFADRRKKKIVHEYKKLLRKEGKTLDDWSEKTKRIYEDSNETASAGVSR